MDLTFDFLNQPFTYRLFVSFYKTIEEFTITMYPSLMDSFGVWVHSIAGFYITFIGIMCMMGKMGDNTKDFGISLLLMVFLHSLISESSTYIYWIMSPFLNLTFDTSSFFIHIAQQVDTGGLTGITNSDGLKGLFDALDGISYQIFDLLFKVDPPGTWVTHTWTYMQTGFLAAGLLVVYVIMYASFMIMIFMGIFSIFVYFIVGGPCIFFASFKKTRSIASAWLKGLLNNCLTVIFASIILSVCVFGVSDSVKDIVAAINDGSGIAWLFLSGPYLSALCWMLLTFALVLKAPDYAAQLTGTIAGSSSGIAGMISLGAGGAVAMIMKKSMKAGRGEGSGGSGSGGGGVGRSFSKSIGVPDNMM